MAKAVPFVVQKILSEETISGRAVVSRIINEYNAILPRDSFDEVFSAQILEFSRGSNRVKNSVTRRNRQFRSHRPKDENIASLRVIANLSAGASEDEKRKLQAGAFVIFGTDQFMLQNVQEMDVERYQIVETFGEPVAFFFGRRPRVYNYSGILFNSGPRFPDFDREEKQPHTAWRDNFKLAYELFLRGTKCVQFRARVYLNYDSVLREGFILNNTIQQTIEPNFVRFSFAMFITREVNIDGVLALASNTLEGKEAPAFPSDASIDAIKQGAKFGELRTVNFDQKLLEDE